MTIDQACLHPPSVRCTRRSMPTGRGRGAWASAYRATDGRLPWPIRRARHLRPLWRHVHARLARAGLGGDDKAAAGVGVPGMHARHWDAARRLSSVCTSAPVGRAMPYQW